MSSAEDVLPLPDAKAADEGGMSNRLAVLAADIRAAHGDVRRATKLSAERAVDAGQ